MLRGRKIQCQYSIVTTIGIFFWADAKGKARGRGRAWRACDKDAGMNKLYARNCSSRQASADKAVIAL